MQRFFFLAFLVGIAGCTSQAVPSDEKGARETMDTLPKNKAGLPVKDGECGDKAYVSIKHGGTITRLSNGTCVLVYSQRYGG